MFECSKCTARAIRAIARDVPGRLQRQNRLPILTPYTGQQRRNAVSLASTQIAKDDESLPFDAATRNLDFSPVPQRHLEIELKWLSDRVKFANHVRDMIFKKNEFDKALALVRLASRSETHKGQCVVAWNHILKYTLDQHDPEKAFSLFNDMKKRAQFPDSHTFVVLFKGLVATGDKNKKPSPKQAARVATIFHSMYAPNSRVKPTAVHANAAMKACALVGDMDALWSISSRLDEEGANSADTITYTIILDALRDNALKATNDNTSYDQVRRLKIEAVEQGRGLWAEVVKKWRAGQMSVDDRLVTVMARLLLLSPRLSDWDDVLNLITQTMDVDRLLPALGDSERQIGHVPQKLGASEPAVKIEIAPTAAAEVFKPLKDERIDDSRKKGKKMDTFQYVRPGAGTLAVILDACFVMRAPKAAAQYWTLLTEKPYKVRADYHNIESFLRICSVNRSSATATKFLAEMEPNFGLKPRRMTFQLAMQACQRNIKNHHVLEHADRLLDEMGKHMEDPDITILIQYLQIALSTDNADKIVHALDHMDEHVHNHKSRVFYGSNQTVPRHVLPDVIENTHSLLRAMVGSIDTLVKRELVPATTHASWTLRRKVLIRDIGTLQTRLEKEKGAGCSEEVAQESGRLPRGPKSRTAHTSIRLAKMDTRERMAFKDEKKTKSAVWMQNSALSKFRRGSDSAQPRRDSPSTSAPTPYGVADSYGDLYADL